MAAVEITMVKPNVPGGSKTLNLKNPTAAAYLNGTLKPEDVILTKNGSVYVKKFKCRVCQYKAAWESEMIRHEVRVHGLDSAAKKKPLPRPIPNLIPIQNNTGSSSTSSSPTPCSAANSLVNRMKPNPAKNSGSAAPLKNGLAQGGLPLADLEYEKPLTEKDLNDIYAKSCANSSLKDFASLIGADESTIKSDRFKDFMSRFSDEKEVDKMRKMPEKSVPATEARFQQRKQDDVEGDVQCESKKLPEALKKKNSFFDRLKEKFGAGETHNLVCWCGHKSKCLSESVLHQKTHSESSNEKNEKSMSSGLLISGAELSSTRCQHCRQRCKTSSDLFVHLQSCPEIIKKGHNASSLNYSEETETNGIDAIHADRDSEVADENGENDELLENTETEKEENKVFVWNNFAQDKDECDEYPEEEFRSKSPASESSLVGYEIAPGIGSVVASSNNDEASENFKDMNIDVHNVETTTKKVFKCPTCTFWASTASRFHVHIVSHMNVKPFGCSVCPYQSKWKWDVTKHIKLKKERDPTHERAEMRTIDVETGRRNYTKYNRFLTVMRVHEPRLDLSTSAKSVMSPPRLQSSVPLLPKLTPAPSMNGDVEANGAAQESDVMMRPLPQLHPANPNVAMKRPHESSFEEGETPKKKMPGEKKMWKCKKCKFRNTDRNIVLAHVKEHYTNNSRNMNDSNALGTESEMYNPSNWERSQSMKEDYSNENQSSSRGTIKCDLCIFETECQSTFRIHSSHHLEDPLAAFKCCFCPFFANDKQFMLNHISSHGVKNAEETLSTLVNSEQLSKADESDDKMESLMDDQSMNEMSEMSMNKSDSFVGDEMEIYKRFKCCSCPYVTNNKSQYLYHKQFHKLRGAPFKCNICSYNVTKRHLLHQHLKIHGVKRAQFKNCIKDAVEKESSEEECFTLNTDVETAHLPDIPLVWVHKTGTLTKMFKCRHCPHVNLRKSNISEHEKMHFDRVMRSPNGSITGNQASTHHCSECNYVCNNAGALASHFKVHQGAFGQICALADPRRSDESQIREITRLLKEDDRFKKDPPKKDVNIEQDKKISAHTVEVPTLGGSRVQSSDATSIDMMDKKATEESKILHFCNVCPARFLYQKDLESHSRFHSAHHSYKCNSCSYSAPQQAQLLAHKRVHTNEYQEKTNAMAQTYEASKDFGRPRTTLISDKPGFAGLGWVVMHTSQKKEDTGSGNKPKTVTKQFSCYKCPAQFFKSVALQHHLTLHGGKDQYQCRGCDYRVKTYGNLIKHEAVHGLEPRLKAKAMKNRKLNSELHFGSTANNASIPSSGTELFQHRSEQILREQSVLPPAPQIVAPTLPSATAGLSVDPEFGIFIHGSPDFIYPQTVKNGKLKEKRYKCHKCPSAFEKREQYKTHVSLHGAKSRFRCQKCDYSVKYFANYTQHMRKHDMNEKCLLERRASTQSKMSEDSGSEKAMDVMSAVGLVSKVSMASDEGTSNAVALSPEKCFRGISLSTPCKAAKTLHISVADQQAVVLMQENISDCGVNMADQLHRCYYCPYSHLRKDAVENHERCHFNPKGSYVCEFCNYTVPQPHFLREHQKLHFGTMKGIKPEAYMKCDRLEIWMETEEGKVLIFKDSGRKENRFEPPVTVNEEESEFKKMYVDVKTGEEFTPCKGDPEFSDDGMRTPIRAVPKPIFDSPTEELLEPCSTPSSRLSSPVPVKDEEATDVNDLKEELMEDDDVGEEQYIDGDEDGDEVDVEVADDDEQEVKSEFEEECGEENDVIEETIDVDEDTNSGKFESDTELSEDVEMEVDEQSYKCDSTNLNEDLMDTLDKDEGNIDAELSVAPDKMNHEIDESTTFTDGTKTVTDDSDSEDSDSSSSSSSCSGSSCSSSDSSDEDDKDQSRDESKEAVFQANQKD